MRAWRPSGAARPWPAAARRAASSSPSSCRRSTPAPESFSFPRSHRLTRGSDLQVVRREGKRIRTEHLEVRALASLLPHPRVGVIVPRYKHSAVDRNRLKRRLREIIRTSLLPALGVQVDVVVRALPHAYAAPFETLHAQLARTVAAIRKVGEKAGEKAGEGKPPRAEPA